MCGLLGFFTEEPSEMNGKRLKVLFKEQESRGRDASGILIYRPWEPSELRFRLIKRPVQATEFLETCWKSIKDDVSRSPLVLAHVRSQTLGDSIDNNNNHPVFGKHWVLTHNGDVRTTEKVKGYAYKGQVDTELMVAHLEHSGVKGLKETVGSAACVFLNRAIASPGVYIWAHHQTMFVGYEAHPRTWWWASTDKALGEIAGTPDRRVTPLHFDMRISRVPEDQLFQVFLQKDGSLGSKSLGELPGKAYSTTYVNTRHACGYSPSTQYVEMCPIYEVRDVEEYREELYVKTADEGYRLDMPYLRAHNIKPYMNEDLLSLSKYTPLGWPESCYEFDPYNMRVVNRAMSLQSLIVEDVFSSDEQNSDDGPTVG